MRKKGLRIILCSLVCISQFNLISFANLQERKVDAVYYNNGYVNVESTSYYLEGVNGWYQEDNNWYYLVNNTAITGLQRIDGKLYLFNTDGKWFEENSYEYNEYMNLLNSIYNAKLSYDTDFKIKCDSFTNKDKYNLMMNYNNQYLLGANNLALSGISFNEDNELIINNYDTSIEKKVNELIYQLRGIKNESDKVKAKQIHDVIIENFDYDYSLGALTLSTLDNLGKSSKIVCGGYAELFEKLCLYYGLECETITGYTTNNVYHAWNRVKINNTWKYVDCTWDDTSNTNEWLLKSYNYFKSTHIQD